MAESKYPMSTLGPPMVGVDTIGGARRCVLCIEFDTVPILGPLPPSPKSLGVSRRTGA